MRSANGSCLIEVADEGLGIPPYNAGVLTAEVESARWFDASGKAQLSRDPRWTALLTWQKSLISWYGYDKLRKFTAASADEFGASNDFEIGLKKSALNDPPNRGRIPRMVNATRLTNALPS